MPICIVFIHRDYTMESGREDNPSIFDTGLGANGDINDYYTVNGYSWDITTDDFWVPYNCYAHNDEYPICSLKRALRDPFTMPTAHEIGRGIMDNPDFIKFAKWYATSYNPVHLFTGTTFLQSPFPGIMLCLYMTVYIDVYFVYLCVSDHKLRSNLVFIS